MLSGGADRSEALRQLDRCEHAARLQLTAGNRRVHQHAHDLGGIAALEHRETLEVQAAGRRRVEHDAPTDGRLGAQHDTVAARGRHRLDEPELCVRATPREPGLHRLRAGVHGDGGGDLRELGELHVQPVRHGIVARLDEHVAARELLPLQRGQVDRDALSGLRLR